MWRWPECAGITLGCDGWKTTYTDELMRDTQNKRTAPVVGIALECPECEQSLVAYVSPRGCGVQPTQSGWLHCGCGMWVRGGFTSTGLAYGEATRM